MIEIRSKVSEYTTYGYIGVLRRFNRRGAIGCAVFVQWEPTQSARPKLANKVIEWSSELLRNVITFAFICDFGHERISETEIIRGIITHGGLYVKGYACGNLNIGE